LLEQQPESPEACLAVCYAMRRGIQHALDDDDADEIEAIWEWAETALGYHSQLRQLWACDLVGEYLATQPQPPGWEGIWSRARAIAASELFTN
jgi:hypothetical protein